MQDEPTLLPALEDSARTGVHLFGLRLATYGVGFVASVMIGRTLGPDGRGRYALPMVVLAIITTLGSLGLEHAQIYLAGRRVPLTTLWANAGAVSVGVTIVVWCLGAVATLASGGSPGSIPAAWLWVALAQVPLLLQTLYWTNLLQIAGRARAAVGATLLGTTVQTLLVVAFVSADELSPFVVLVLSALANLLTWGGTLLLGIGSGLVSWRVDRGALRIGVRFGMHAQLGIVFVFLLFRADQVMVQRILGFESLGLYSLAVTLAELLWLLSDPFATALLRHQVQAGGDDDVSLGYATARLGLLTAGSAAAIAWFAAPFLIRLAYGEEFSGAIWPFRLLLPGIVALAVQRPLAAVLLKRGRPGLVSLFGALALGLNVALNLALLRRLGPAAAAMSSSAAYLLLAAAYVWATGGSPGRLVPTGGEVSRLGRALRGAVRPRAATRAER
jgi:O-antigen/teichoic acid export membrane protein